MELLSVKKFLHSNGIDVALFFNQDANLTYFTGVKPHLACLAIPSSGKPLLFVPGFEAERMAKASRVDVVHIEKDLLGTIYKQFPGKNIGVVPSALSFANAQAIRSKWNAKIVSIEDKCIDLRLKKSKEEIAKITKACAITDCLLDELCKNLPLLKTELDAASFLNSYMSQMGFDPSFPAIVASGSNGATPHHVPSHSKLAGFTVIDFGIIYKNYCSDLTRTVFIGKPSQKDRNVYQKLLQVQENCIKKVKPGITLQEINEFARKSVGKTMIHSVGHSLGIEVHDVQPKPLLLQPGCVITIEPGTYPGLFGIRIEDDVLVTQKGPVVLTRSSKNFRAISKV